MRQAIAGAIEANPSAASEQSNGHLVQYAIHAMIFTKSRIAALRFIWPTVLGHRLLLHRLFAPAWPRIAPLARLYRRRIIPRTCIIAVVGSLGKTTTRRMVAAGLGGRVPRQPDDNCNHWIAVALFRVGPWHKEAVMEVGISRPGEMAPIADFLKPDIVVVTSIRHSEQTELCGRWRRRGSQKQTWCAPYRRAERPFSTVTIRTSCGWQRRPKPE